MDNQNTGAKIQQAQNSPESLRLLSAQRQLYLEEKFLLGLQLTLAFLSAIFGALVALNAALTIHVLFAGFFLAFVNEMIGIFMGRKQKQAARIQEQFDCSVLNLPWHRLTAGDPESPETIEAAFRRYEPSKHHNLHDWYMGALEKLPVDLARILCQRTNCSYDIGLREKYLGALSILFASSVTLVCFIGFFGSMSVQDWILKLVGPLLPGFFLFIRQRQSHMESVKRLEQLRSHADELWNLASARKTSNKKLVNESRELQNAIFDHRSKSVVQFDWLYNHFRNRLDSEHTASNDTLIEQYTSNNIVKSTR